MGCGCITANWNNARSGDKLASGPGVILDDIKGCIHICATLPFMSEVNLKPELHSQNSKP